MVPIWNPFITASTATSVITPTAIPVTESTDAVCPCSRRFVRKWRRETNRTQFPRMALAPRDQIARNGIVVAVGHAKEGLTVAVGDLLAHTVAGVDDLTDGAARYLHDASLELPSSS